MSEEGRENVRVDVGQVHDGTGTPAAKFVSERSCRDGTGTIWEPSERILRFLLELSEAPPL